jgi:protein TIF31
MMSSRLRKCKGNKPVLR